MAQQPDPAGCEVPVADLIIHGGRDYRVPSDQGLELYGIDKARGLDAAVDISRREPLDPFAAYSLHWYGEFLGWMDRYLGRHASWRSE